MGIDFPGKTAVLAAIALAPAVLRWWWGGRLLAHAGDPALAERMLAVARRTRIASAIALAPLIVLSPRGAAWTLPLLVLGRLVAAYPSRRVLFEERWSIAGYLSFTLRLFAAVYGLWILIALLPMLVRLGGTNDWLVAALLAGVLLAWNLRSSEVAQRLLGARPIDDPVLHARFAAMAQAAGLSGVRFARVDLRGGALTNAAALPSRRHPAVIFTDPLLTQLGPAEVSAICAHELAHHEYYSPTRVRRMRLVNAALIVSGAALVPLAQAWRPRVTTVVTLLWYLGFVAVAAWRARHLQRNETQSDVRAVALCGDAEALIRGLTQLYALARVPRRLDPQFERQATHPSLARRIRDIRRAAGLSASTLSEDARFATADGTTVVTFQPDRLNWSEGEAASHSLSYAHLAEVRVSAPNTGPPSLIVVERGGRRWTMPLESGDVGRAQAVLDVVDGRLADAMPAPAARQAFSRLVATIAALLALPVGHVAAGVLALMVAIRPSSPLLAGAGLGTFAAAAVTIRDHGVLGLHAVAALLMALAAALLLTRARATRHDPPPPRAWWPLTLLALGAVLSTAMMSLGGFDAVTLHQSARGFSAPLVLSLAMAGAFLWMRRPAAIVGAIAAALVAAGVSVAGSTWFLDRFGHDPLLVRGPSIKGVTLPPTASTEVRLPFYASTVRLSPGGRAIAVAESEDESDDTAASIVPTFHVGRRGGTLLPIAADDLRFVDDDRALLLVSGRDGLELREVAIAPPNRTLWTVHLPPMAGPRLSLDTTDLTWRILGWNRARDIVRLEGQVGDVAFRETRWPLGPVSDGYISALAASEDRATAVESRYEVGVLQRAAPATFARLGFGMPQMQSTVRSAGPGGAQHVQPSRFGAQCVAEPASATRLLCSVFDGTDTRLVTLSARGEINAVGTLPGRFFGRDAAGRDWLLGWGEATSLAIRVSTREAFRVNSVRGEWIADAGINDLTFATIGYGEQGSVVRVYARDDR